MQHSPMPTRHTHTHFHSTPLLFVSRGKQKPVSEDVTQKIDCLAVAVALFFLVALLSLSSRSLNFISVKDKSVSLCFFFFCCIFSLVFLFFAAPLENEE